MQILNLTKNPSENEVLEMHSINQENIPEVGDVSDIEDFKALVYWSEHIFVYKWKEVIKAFVFCMREGNSYHSENYKYVSKLFPRFLYVDRIAVQEDFRRKGIAEEIYSKVITTGKNNKLDVLCEVNTRPSNKPSLAFHKKMGFEEVGSNDFEKNSVVYLRRPYTKE